MAVNERKDAFKTLIMQRMREAGNDPVSRDELAEYVKAQRPDLCDDSEPCYPGCDSHKTLWRHQFERCIYDLRSSVPTKLRSAPNMRGYYVRF